ncbi:MAG: tetratricopeptide repeat protein [Anaerolineales bacterium]|nr:tetratricopeptide repeat protein [Anaerolineales bacterium]
MSDTQQIYQLEQQLAADGFERNPRQKIELLNNLAWLLSDTDLKRAQTLSETAFNLATSPATDAPSDQIGLAYSLRTQGYLNMRLGNHSLGLSQLFKAQEIFESLNHSQGLPDVFDHIAGIYFQIGDFPESLSYIYKQLETAQYLDDKRLIANAYNNLANIYFETGDHNRAIETLQQNLQLASEISFARIECLSYLNLAETYLALGNSALALEHSLRSLKVSRAAGFELFEIYALDFIGKAYLKLGNTRQALAHFEEALALSRKIESKVNESLNLHNLGQAHRGMQQLDFALDYVQQGVTTAQAIHANSELLKGHLLLSEIYEQQGDFAQALHHLKQHHAFKELVLGEKADQRLKVLQVAHDTEAAKKEAEIHRVHNEELKQEIAERQRIEKALKISQERYRLATQAGGVGVWDWNLQTGQFYLDPTIKAILGYNDEEIPNDIAVWAGYIHPADSQAVMAAAQAHIEGRTPDYTYEHRMLHKDGSTRWVLVQGKVIHDEQGQAVRMVGTDTDITARKEIEAQEHRQRQIAESLQQVALVLNSTLDQQQVVTAILGQLQGVVPYDGAALWLADGAELVIVEAAGSGFHRVGWKLSLAQNSPQALVVHNRRPRIIADVIQEPEWPHWTEERVIRSWMGVPLLAGQEAMGLLSLERSEADAYNQADLQVLESLANQAVTAISNARLYQQVNTAHEQLSILYQASQLISAASLVPQQIYAGIYAAVTQLMPADVFVVTLINETEQEAEDVYLIDQGQAKSGRRYPLPGTFADYLLRRGASLRADDYSAISQEAFKFELLEGAAIAQSGLTVLLRGREQVLGVLSVRSYQLATYTSDDLETLELLASHAAIALENTRLYQQAQTAAALEERNRLARDLHDSVTQSLYSLTLLAEGWRRLAQRGRLTDLDSVLTELGEIAQQSLKEMRLLIYELRPPVLEQAGLLGALHQRLGAVERRAGIEARLIAEELINLPPQLEKGLYRITQEALNNALKHARATTVTVFVRARGEWIEIEVDDNGCGFEPERLNGQSGLGLVSMRERAEQLGGELIIESKPGMGTTVKVKVKGNS